MQSAVPPVILFKDRALGARSLASLYEAFITSGSVFAVDRFARAVEQALAESPDPDLALVNLLRFVEASFSRASLFNDLVQVSRTLDLLLKLFGSSRYLADILVREPELFRWLTSGDVMDQPIGREELASEFGRVHETFTRPERVLDAIKRVHRRAILRIGAQDIMGTADVASVTAQLSDLADAALNAVYRQVSRQMEGSSAAPAARFSVLALGKLGGGELNFSSDIDIVVVYDEEGTFRDLRGEETTHHEYFNRLSELLVQQLSQPTAEGYLYRVDTRLRPESGAGPLARSLRSYLIHYEARGELWERQMLIKARPVAGDISLGEEFIAQLQPFIYPRTFFQHPADAISRIKARIEAKIGDEKNIKLRAGGIRDIEFAVQALQLINGGRHRQLREPNTLRAMAALTENGFLSVEEGEKLASAYRMYRMLEHRLQIMANTQTHTMPEDPATLSSLARRMGFPDSTAFASALDGRLRQVRAIFDQVMSVRAPKGEGGIRAFIDGSLGDEEAAEVLASFGFADQRAAARAIRSMAGASLTGRQELDARTRGVFRDIAPELFREISQTPDPDLTIRNVAMLAAPQAVPKQLYGALSVPNFRRLLLGIASTSPRVTRQLALSPLLLEGVIADVRALAEDSHAGVTPGADLAEYKSGRELRSALRYVLGFSSLPELTAELTLTAEAVVGAVLRRGSVRMPPLAVFALGKFGTGELTFDSDLDLLFVCAPSPATRQSRIEGAASSLMTQLSSVSEKGRLYQVDARLRPEGRNAPLVTDLPGYAEYLRRRASLWERQSLVRARFVCGHAGVAREFSGMIRAFVYEMPLPSGWVEQIVSMRRKMETRSRTRGKAFVDIKLGPGGMADIEFVVQMIQMCHGGSMSGLRFGSTPSLLGRDGLPELTQSERLFLLESYLWYRKIETLLRLTLEERTTLLPEGGNLRTLALCAERQDEETFLRGVEERMKKVRGVFLAFCRRLEHH